jgi:hypothetical protein
VAGLNKILHGSLPSFPRPKDRVARRGAVDIFLDCRDRGVH